MPTPTSLANDASNGIWDWGFHNEMATLWYAKATGMHENFGRLAVNMDTNIPGVHSYDAIAITALWIHYANTMHAG